MGTDVWLDGKPVGKVVWVRFQPPTVDPAHRLLIALDVAQPIESRIRRDTRAQIKAGTSLIGAPVIDLAGGSAAARALANGDTLVTVPHGEFDDARASLALTAQNLPQVLENVRAVRTLAVSTSGTIGAFEGEGGPARRFISLADNIGELSARLEYRHGALHRVGADDLVAQARRVLAHADSIEHSASAQAARADRLRDDSAMKHDIRDARAELAAVQTLLASSPADSIAELPGAGPGLARLRYRMATLDAELGVLLTDLIHRPLRYLAF